MLPMNPFLYGKPVPPARFVGRQDMVRTVFSRLHNGESTAVVGEPHIGKSSLLGYVKDEGIRKQWLVEDVARYFFTEIDCHMLPHHCTPADFWGQALAAPLQAVPDETLAHQWQVVLDNRFSSFALDSLFRLLARGGRRVVLIIDEFDTLLHHPNFNAEFFGALRSIATRSDGLAVITASRLPVATMNRRSLELNPHGSPFFNNVTEVRLPPLSLDECRSLMGKTMGDTGVAFTEEDYAFIHTLAGRHPYLVQMAAAGLFDATVQGKTGPARYQAASEFFHAQAANHFDDFWRHLSGLQQLTLAVLALGEMKGRMDRQVVNASNLGGLERYAPQLTELQNAGMAEPVDADSGATGVTLWYGARWRAASRGFVWWVIDNVVAGTRDTIGLEPWLQDQEVRRLLTREQAARVRNLANSIPKVVVSNPANMVALLLGDIPEKGVVSKVTPPDKFDVFFSYNRADRKAVVRIAERLKERGILPWLDVWALRPGLPWQEALEKQIRKISAAAVFVGRKGIGPWQDREQAAFIRQFVKRQCPVIPVLLPGSKKVPDLPPFLEGMTWVDFRTQNPDPLDRLVWGITGERKSSP